jgi:hypothetical protein
MDLLPTGVPIIPQHGGDGDQQNAKHEDAFVRNFVALTPERKQVCEERGRLPASIRQINLPTRDIPQKPPWAVIVDQQKAHDCDSGRNNYRKSEGGGTSQSR